MSGLHYGRYETVGLIASGGMASVYLGRARGPAGFERFVAIKVMHDHIARDPEFSSMFLDEARLAAQIRHPNVVPTLDVAEDGHIIVMEYIEGASLNDLLRRERRTGAGPLPLPITLRIMMDVLDGLHAAHELCDQDRRPLKIVHRDVSPHNILVGIDGVGRLTDFGIAYAKARLTSTRKGQLKGKMPYMAPEQLEGAEVDRRIDVYAAGCVLWEMLAGRRLFQADNEAALACRVLAGPELSPREANEQVPPAIAGACMRALEERSRRYATALEFCEALEQAARSSGVEIARSRAVGALARKATTSLVSLMDAGGPVGAAEPTGGTAAADAPTATDRPRPAATGTDRLAVSATADVAAMPLEPALPLAERPVSLSPVDRGTADGATRADPAATAPRHPAPDQQSPRPASLRDGAETGSPSAPRSKRGLRVGLALLVGGGALAAGGWLALRTGGAVVDERGDETAVGATTVGSVTPASATAASAAGPPGPSAVAPSGATSAAGSPGAPSTSEPTATSRRPTGSRPAPVSPSGERRSSATSAPEPTTITPAPSSTASPTSTVFHPPRL